MTILDGQVQPPGVNIVGAPFGIPINELIAVGALLLVAALLARLGRRIGLPTIPFFMATGILLGPGTPGPVLIDDPAVIEFLATMGLVLLLFHLGVEFPLEQVRASGGRLVLVAFTYIGLNVSGGIVFGLFLGWGVGEALVIGGALGISSSAIVTKLLIELRRLANAETPLILGIIVVEDLFLALYLSLLTPILGDAESPLALVVDIGTSFLFLLVLLVVARFGGRVIAAVIRSREEELLTIGVVGLVFLVAGTSAELGVSDAIGALMIGLVVSRTSLKDRVERVVLPLRDVFAAVFFIAFGLTIDVRELGDVVLPALLAVLLTVTLNVVAGVIAARMYRLNQRAAANISLTLLGRGEFSLILASLAIAAGLDERVGPFVALYLLILAVLSPLAASRSHMLARILPDRLFRGNFTYVRELTTSSECTHLDSLVVNEPDGPLECRRCREDGLEWVHLRLCTSCGNIACCDDSPGRHATEHFTASGHPIIASAEPGETWRFCYVDELLLPDSAKGTSDPAVSDGPLR
ncbi:cation:proton antiporter [Microbacterium sp. ABRD28]|uniref:cation:proton antiporter domain-containing protein n=1 Tax=Microbacterium sp. ABRD28 TaxID=2268461 RepID=UPI000F5529AC|nr:cation:proton antiporter [Microbacterium sp. ABRD28]AZC13012.1 cation/H(+) antiporter [Microbacterium sp. ABRD28]